MTQTLAPQAPERDILTQADATARARRIADVSYRLAFDLRASATDYGGDATIAFAVLDASAPLAIDFRGREVLDMEVDGRAVEPDRQGDRLVLAPELLAERMTVRIRYRNDYDTTGEGFHRFVDPEDGEEYVYSNFQPFSAHRLFPCFDQPDLKATYEVEVVAPQDWKVVSAEPAADAERLPDGRTRHRFPRTRPFSTYLFALVCGPWESAHHARTDGIALGLYCRRSLWRFLEPDADELFTLTSQGFDHYMTLFDQPYPFTKYDQLFVPEFNAGAMENVGAVTFSESFLFRDPPTEAQRQSRGEVVLHELAHMWFGDLVTMRWWDDLWLNESFATYISYDALTEATRFRGAWRAFATQLKRWAYRQDQLPTTHPIRGVVADTDVAFLDFDGITYGKGASVLKQLVATIGRDGFRDGLRVYFRRHAWGNATLADFMTALEEGSGRELGEWSRVWLETASLDTISAHWTADDGRLSSLRLEQRAPAEHPILRPHTLRVGLLSEGEGRMLVEALDARIDGASADVPEAVGRRRPSLVFPNHDDHAYAKVELDPISLAFVRERLSGIEDALLRELLWMSLWEMVRDARLPSPDYLAIVRAQLRREPDAELLGSVLERAQATLAWYVPGHLREREASAIVDVALGALERTSDPDARIIWLRAAIAAAASARDLEPLVALADGEREIQGVVVDQRMRWDLAVKATAFGSPGADARVAEEMDRDPSDRGQRARIRAQVARPDSHAKSQAWDRINGEGYGSFHLTRAAMEGFLWPSQAELVRPWVDRFWERVREIFATRDHPFASAYGDLLFPSHAPDADVVERGRALLAQLGEDEVLLRRSLREHLDDVERALRVRALAERVSTPATADA